MVARRFLVIAAFAALSACATVKTPTLQVERIGKAKIGITGGRFEVAFGVRNPNPEPLLVEKIEYELRLNGRRVGRGYVVEPVRLDGFARVTVLSQADLDLIRVPGAIRDILDEDRVQARAKGDFYVRDGDRLRKLGFDSQARVELK